MFKRLFLFIILGTMLVVAVQAQEPIEPITELVNPSANISYPPPVYTLRGEVEIRGTANLPNQTNYFIEFRPLDLLSEEADEDRPWFPATLPSTVPVVEDILGTWNTRTAPDDLYELRLTINISGGVPQFFRLSPLRIENNPPDFVELDQSDVIEQPAPVATVVIDVPTRPTLVPTPTPLSRDPEVTAITGANVRLGDSTSYEVVGSIQPGETVPVLGVSSYGSGWFYVELSTGQRGFVAPSVVRISGDVYSTPRINPPFTPTPPATNTPIFTVTPTSAANLHFIRLDLSPSSPQCNQAFNVIVGVQNNGTTASTSSGQITVTDTHVASGTVTEMAFGGFPVLQPGEIFTSTIPITVSTFFDEEHELRVEIDSGNQVPEQNEGDNVSTRRYTLEEGNC